jgi:hypothetical protein
MPIATAVNGVTVSVADLWRLHASAREFRQRANVAAGEAYFLVPLLFADEPKKVAAVFFRMEALAEVLAANGYDWWSLPDDPESEAFARGNIFAAAASEPLVQVGTRLRFHQGSFIRRAREFARARQYD